MNRGSVVLNSVLFSVTYGLSRRVALELMDVV